MVKHTLTKMRPLGSTAPIAVLLALSCTLCVWMYYFVCVSLCVIASLNLHVVCMCLFPVGLTPKLISLRVKHPENIDFTWKLEESAVATGYSFQIPKVKNERGLCPQSLQHFSMMPHRNISLIGFFFFLYIF